MTQAIIFSMWRLGRQIDREKQTIPAPIDDAVILLDKEPRPMEQPLIDFAALLGRSMGDVDFAKETLERFSTRADEDLTAIYRAMATETYPEVARVAHGLKSVAGHVGATSLQNIASQVEQLGYQANYHALTEMLNALRDSIQNTTAYIPTALQQTEQPTADV